MRVNNVGQDIIHAFETLGQESEEGVQAASIPSFQDIFGSLDYCECEHCRSIFSPAAYFVDLMRIIDRHITQPNKVNIPKHLLLEARRPDLAEIELTCANTNDLVPHLELVNKSLAGVVQRLAQNDENGVSAFAEAQEGEEVGKDPFELLSGQPYPFKPPFHLPLTQIRSVLAQLDTSLADIYRVFGAKNVEEKEVARELLGLSYADVQLLTQPETDAEKLGASYGVSELDGAAIENLSSVDEFLARTGLTLKELNQLFYQNLSKPEIDEKVHKQFFINGGQDAGKWLEISEDGDEIENLTADALDRINRFIRLAKKLRWSFADLDWALRSIAGNNNPRLDDPKVDNPRIDEESIRQIANIQQIADKSHPGKLDVISSFWFDLKTIGRGDGKASEALFDKVF